MFVQKIIIGLCILGLLLLVSCTPKLAKTKFLNYQTKAQLSYPLKGESLVVWGGRTLKKNQHASEPDQRFALDIVALAPGSKPPPIDIFNIITYHGNPKENKSYYCFGRTVVAPASGVVVDMLDGIPDNIPGQLNRENVAGNFVVIDHGNNEYSMLAHLKNHSVVVKKGDHIKVNTRIGQCGNSGNSDEAHLHYHVQNTPVWGKGEGLPLYFNNLVVNGKLVNRVELEQGNLVEAK